MRKLLAVGDLKALLARDGLSILPSCLPHQFHFVNMNKTWTEAQRICRQNYTDLATIDDTADMKKLNNTSDSSYRKWESGEPNRAKNGDFCAEVKLSGRWNDERCNNNNNFICYDDELVLVPENKTWSEALWHCRDLDMELVSAHNQNIQHWVRQRAKKASTPFVWLGLRYTCTLDFWFWVNGEESCYHNWADGEGYNTGKEQCGNTGAIQRDGGQWVGLPETERFNFICSKSDGEI
ncbi:lymphocyte antigen 75-like [Coregonus clupeaformis]|uniref:lymphocyte antigen 75-like n=1 Tax=Coregonus clupeaformis TaxID=59861 RepID=UPI001E1C29D3|nr:lymphocyte antigen 75-like [Coregonus clupeaformis]